MKSTRVIFPTMMFFAFFAVFTAPDLLAQKTIKGEKLEPSFIGPSIVESMQAAIERDQAVPRPLPPEPRERNGRQGNWKVPV